MVEIVLPYGEGTVRAVLPDGIEVDVVEPRGGGPLPAANSEADETTVVERALDAPSGRASLVEEARKKNCVTVVVPDSTRPARTAVTLPPVLARLAAAGVPDASIAILVGGGIHQPATAAEAGAIVGEDVARRFRVVATTPDDPSAYADLPPDSRGKPFRVHRLVAEADLVLLTGAVAPHYLAGFSGGAKALVPGCADRETVLAAHRLTLDATVAPDGSVTSWLGRTEGNPFRDALSRAAVAHGRCFAICVSLAGGRIVLATAGDVLRAHEEAVAKHRARFAVARPRPADLVIAGGGAPRDRDLVQCHKALVVAAEVAKEGAPIVWLARADKGPGHPRFLPWFETGRLERHLAALRRDFHPYGLTAYALRWKAKRHPVHVVSEVSRDVLVPMGLLPHPGVQSAVDAALAGGVVERVVVLPRAAETLFAYGGDSPR